MPQVTLQDATIEYRVLGPDDSAHPPVLFIHGILVDHMLWTKAAEELARNGFRCILPDLPLGAHRIPVADSVPLTPVTVAEMIHEFIEALDLRDVTLVGNDTGGGLCQLTNALSRVAHHAGMEIVERHSHSVHPEGFFIDGATDATVFWNYVDFRFRSAGPVRIGATLSETMLSVRLDALP